MNFFLFIFTFLCCFCFINFTFATCPNDTVAYFGDNSICFSFQSNQTYFLDAEGVCIGMGGHLASVDSMFENMFLSQKALIKFTDSTIIDFWFGATNLLKPPTWTWIDGSTMDFTDWDKNQPQNISEAGCGSIIMQGGNWVANDCYKPKPFVCLIKDVSTATTLKQITTTTAIITPSTPKSCEGSWTYGDLTGYCYKLYFNENMLNAETMCKMEEAHLVSIHSKEENLFVANLAYTTSSNYINQTIIGAFTEDNNVHWKWTDGTPFNFHSWMEIEPNDPGVDNCVQLWTGSPLANTEFVYGGWNNIPCDWILSRFVCKKLPS